MRYDLDSLKTILLIAVLIVLSACSVAYGVLVRLGYGTDWYCMHLAGKNDTFCVVRELRKP